ncbi:DUF2254 domain-containing protein [Neolewinella persica]|uniref:DUF2254 domain-containing protein n=1 Tax=Neolewinella persica TaxID=70998 RepID=UPI00037FDBEE|nr:DUF2254 domain-containing protein [Neolewinella persica]
MQRIYRFFLGWVRNAFDSLAFLPLPMMIIAMLLGFGLFSLELNTEISAEISENLPAVVISSQDTARAILGILIGGVITLMVFTFTQMMTLFSQVANSYSPRLLPMFTGSRALQFVMGFYLATIILSIIVLLSIREDDNGFVPNLSVLLCIVLGVLCLVFFLYFVTTISNKIQVSHIIEEVYGEGLTAIEKAIHNDDFTTAELPENLQDWYAIPSPIGGFVGTVNHHQLSRLAKDYGSRFYIGTAKGQFVPMNNPLLLSEQELDEEQINKVMEAVSPISQKFNNWYLPPIRLLTEIAVRAMSPGINDPGTAIDVMDRLTGLMGRLMNLPKYNKFCGEEGGGEVWLKVNTFEEVLVAVMQELRQYCKQDVLVMRRLLQMLFHLLGGVGKNETFQQTIIIEIQALLEDAGNNIINSADRRVLAREAFAARQELRHMLKDTEFLLDAHLSETGVK